MKNIKTDRIISRLAISAFFLFTILIFGFLFNKTEYESVKFDKKYSGVIKSKFVSRSSSLICLGEIKLEIMPANNYDYSPSGLCLFLIKGDSILKPANSYNLYIFRNQRKFSFVIDYYEKN